MKDPRWVPSCSPHSRSEQLNVNWESDQSQASRNSHNVPPDVVLFYLFGVLDPLSQYSRHTLPIDRNGLDV